MDSPPPYSEIDHRNSPSGSTSQQPTPRLGSFQSSSADIVSRNNMRTGDIKVQQTLSPHFRQPATFHSVPAPPATAPLPPLPSSSFTHPPQSERSSINECRARPRRCSSSYSSTSSSTDLSEGNQKSHRRKKSPSFDKRKSTVEVKENNKKLNWNQDEWVGKLFSLKTTNAMIDVQGSLDAKSISLNTTNAMITWRGKGIQCKEMDLRTTNAKIDLTGGDIDVRRECKIKTSNARLIMNDSKLMTKELSLVTSNAEIRMNNLLIRKSITAKTSNAPVILYIRQHPLAKPDAKIHVEVSTSNAPVTIHMPSNFAGDFKLTTSSTNAVVMDDPQQQIVYNDVKKSAAREGYRYKKSRGSLKVSTSLNDITIAFDM
ncbi:uncharacterized protein BX664DRAFT_339814 [Halteromyces radiatus]|uniref:uncharacterized protein n=1 Tax=Halteromyces radiatus TaxID=101107 RepID=UPI00221E96A1|nr:uncharacterized protein BX664DRAFT_339814 [Halteromyces radiatus]KAI8083099.1 hypothetical protein BX664DRAFT_339814 [Halteromyces radiatus]